MLEPGDDEKAGEMKISVCMIVKNEEKTLPVCLKSLEGIADELIVVDTGSTDATVAVAEAAGAEVFHFDWVDDFARARNFAFSKASCDYIYSADADEELDEENRERFLRLKNELGENGFLPDIVQFYYTGQLTQVSVYNYDREYRPKLFKRERPFVWEGAVHEQVRLEPDVFDSEIEIMHKPHGQHADRDLAIFRQMAERELEGGERMSSRLFGMYARELYIAGTPEDLDKAAAYMAGRADEEENGDAVEAACLVVLRGARLSGDDGTFFRYALRLMNSERKSSELCCELGDYYFAAGETLDACLWFMQAADVEKPVLDIRAGGQRACLGAAECLRAAGDEAGALVWQKRSDEG